MYFSLLPEFVKEVIVEKLIKMSEK